MPCANTGQEEQSKLRQSLLTCTSAEARVQATTPTLLSSAAAGSGGPSYAAATHKSESAYDNTNDS